VRRRKKYRLPGARTAGCFIWVILVLVIAVAIWVWWEYRQANSEAKKAQPTPDRTPTLRMTKPGNYRTATNPPPTPQTVVTSAPPPAHRESGTSNGAQVVPRVAQPVAEHPSQLATFAGYPRPAKNVFEAQIVLAHLHFSPGSIDGVFGPQTRQALVAWQQSIGLATTGSLNQETLAKLVLESVPWTTNVVSAAELSRLQPLSSTWVGKSQQSALDYESILEMYAERSQSSPKLLKLANPTLDWSAIKEGDVIYSPNLGETNLREKASFVVIRLHERTLQAFGAQTNLLAHFPCSIAQRVEKRPVGELKVEVVVPNPDYTFDPAVFPESPEARQITTKLMVPPGPNNPVGVAWIGLNLAGYGIHGTPNPEQVGRTESHGCFRLANWNAEWLVKLVWVGMPVFVLE
jgi:lipoprotein-anchoring transpeptidase ErfK/SrfK